MKEHHITDIHMHCVWGYDDGSCDREMTCEMLSLSFEQGVRRIVCTSHGNSFVSSQERYDRQFTALEQLAAAEFPDLQVCSGTEIHVHPRDERMTAEMLRDGRLHSLGSSQRAMIELSVQTPLEQNLTIINRLMDEGLQIVIAHAERYHNFAESIAEMETLVSRGCRIQVNAYSLALERNPVILRKARELVKRRLVHYIGSDAHRTFHRPPLYTDGINWIYENVPEDYADQIVYSNADEFFV